MEAFKTPRYRCAVCGEELIYRMGYGWVHQDGKLRKGEHLAKLEEIPEEGKGDG